MALVACVSGVALTLSRGGLVAMAAVACLFVADALWRGRFRVSMETVPVALMLLAIAAGVLWVRSADLSLEVTRPVQQRIDLRLAGGPRTALVSALTPSPNVPWSAALH